MVADILGQFFIESLKWCCIFGLPTYFAIKGKKPNELEKLMESCGIKNKNNQTPKVIDKKENSYGYDVILSMPEGLCLNDFKKHKEPIEQYLDGEIEFSLTGNRRIKMSVLKSMLKDFYKFQAIGLDGPVEFPLGYSRKGIVTLSLDDSNPHALVGGTSGSGKSVCLRVIITSLILTKPKNMLKLHLCDLKGGNEFNVFEKSSFVETFATDIGEAMDILLYLKEETNKRFALFRKSNVVNIDEYNRKNKPLPRHLLVIDEFGNFQKCKDALEIIDYLLRMSRSVGIHLIIATQRPDTQTLPGTLKANISATVAFKVRNDVNSMILLDNAKAADLKGKGHGILSKGIEDIEFQGMFLSVDEVKELIIHTYVEKVKKTNVLQEPEDDTSGVIRLDSNG